MLRDLKSSNVHVFLDEDSQLFTVKLGDVGMAQVMEVWPGLREMLGLSGLQVSFSYMCVSVCHGRGMCEVFVSSQTQNLAVSLARSLPV